MNNCQKFSISSILNLSSPPSLLVLPFSQVTEFKVNTQDVFKRAQKSVLDIHDEIQTLEIQMEEVSWRLPRETWRLAPPHPDYLPLPSLVPLLSFLIPLPSALRFLRAQDNKTIEHMEKVNLQKYQVTLIASTIGTISLCV